MCHGGDPFSVQSSEFSDRLQPAYCTSTPHRAQASSTKSKVIIAPALKSTEDIHSICVALRLPAFHSTRRVGVNRLPADRRDFTASYGTCTSQYMCKVQSFVLHVK